MSPALAVGTMLAVSAFPLVVVLAHEAVTAFTFRRVGGLLFFKVGRLGGSFYLSKQ